MLDTATSSVRTQLVGRIRPDVPYHGYFTKAVESAFDIAERFEAERDAILRDRRFSDEGKSTAVAALVADRFAGELASGPARTARHAAQRNESRRSALGRPTFDKTDLVAAMERQELRTYLRSLTEGTRLPKALELARDRRLAETILSGRTVELTGLTARQFEEVHTFYLQTHFADQLTDIEAEREDITAVASSVQIARTKLVAASGLSQHQFDQLWLKLEEKADR